jgi:hypothetical protein
MSIENIKNRVKKVERITGMGNEAKNEALIILEFRSYENGTVPNVIDRPMKEWELYKRSMACSPAPIIILDPLEEYRLRTGKDEAPPEDRMPVSAYHAWLKSDKNG